MTEDATPDDPMPPPPGDGTSTAGEGTSGTRPKGRWIRKVIARAGVAFLILLLLVALLPTLLSSGPGRTFVLGWINENLNGQLTVAEWSIGWTDGIHAEGVKLFDDGGRQILQIPHFRAHLSLLNAIRGNIHLGKTSIEGLDFFAERFPDGTINFSRLVKSRWTAPRIDDLELIGCRGTFQDDQDPDAANRAIEFRTISGDVKIRNAAAKLQFSNFHLTGAGEELTITGNLDDLKHAAKSNRLAARLLTMFAIPPS